jgi:hypothetical protein
LNIAQRTTQKTNRVKNLSHLLIYSKVIIVQTLRSLAYAQLIAPE